jgi:hypothetical protein
MDMHAVFALEDGLQLVFDVSDLLGGRAVDLSLPGGSWALG